MKTGTSPKTLRIPNDTIADIERVAQEKKTSFSKEANRRLKGRDNTDYPLFLAKTQTIINLCWEGVNTGNKALIIAIFKFCNDIRQKLLYFFT